MVPESNAGMGLGAISSLVSASIPSIGSKLLGGNANTDRIMGILQSRLVHEQLISEFDLINYYKTNGDFDKTLKAFRNDFIVDINQNMMIEISYIHEDRIQCSKLVNRSVYILDSLNKGFGLTEAKSNRIFIEKRYLKNISDLRSAEDSLNQYQKKYGIFSIDEQMKAMFKITAELESEILKREIQLSIISQTLGQNSSQYLTEKNVLDQIKTRLDNIKNDNKLAFESTVILPLKVAPDLGRAYLRIIRNIEIQSKILQVILPIYEQALMEEQKFIPTVITLDIAKPATYKAEPKRIIIVVIVTTLFLLVYFICAFLIYNSHINSGDPLSKKISEIGYKIEKYYFVK